VGLEALISRAGGLRARTPALILQAPTGKLKWPRSARLTRAGEFAKLKREGVSFHGKFMVLSVLTCATGEATRIGLITSRRVGGAVIRSKVRRRLREIVRGDRPKLEAGRWLVLIARQRAVSAGFEELRGEWRGLARRGGVLQPENPKI